MTASELQSLPYDAKPDWEGSKGAAPEMLQGYDSAYGTVDTVIDPKAESRMMRKFDLFAVVPLGVLYMLAILDRSNLGNANIGGMPAEISLVGNQFGTATTLLFVTYVPFEAPLSLLVKSVGPKYLISVSALCWGAVTLGMAFITNYKGLYACRILMGMFEAGLIPSCNVYLALVYKKSERGKRVCLFYAFSALSSAFGGLLAYGLIQIHGPNGFSGWRWLFAVEGAATIVLVPIFFVVFPRSPMDAWFLTDGEKKLMLLRYESDIHWGHDEDFSWAEVFKVVVDPKWYAFWLYQFGVDLTLYGFTTFLPAIVQGLGYTSVTANLMTVPIYAASLLFFVVVAFYSDRWRLRGPFLALCTALLFIGLVLLVAVENTKILFLACFFVALGIYPATSLSMMWLQDNVAKYYKRSSMVGMTLTLANTAGVVVGQIFTTDSSPRYIKGLSVCLGFAVLAFAIVVSLMIAMGFVNRKRSSAISNAEQSGHPLPSQPDMGDYDVHFRYSL
ncbi:major facilitator superfamily domain-containing protein [Hypoxylon cercidicola]|nr:major facilitator superfamily domain-containing protein [Hypoxylon cercidicola]